MEVDFHALIASDATIAGLVSTRISPAIYSQGTDNPAIRYTKVAGSVGLHAAGSDGLSESTMQVDVRSITAGSARDVRDAIVSKLHGFAGVQGGTDFRLIRLDADRGGFEKPANTGYYTATLDFTVWHRAA